MRQLPKSGLCILFFVFLCFETKQRLSTGTVAFVSCSDGLDGITGIFSEYQDSNLYSQGVVPTPLNQFYAISIGLFDTQKQLMDEQGEQVKQMHLMVEYFRPTRLQFRCNHLNGM